MDEALDRACLDVTLHWCPTPTMCVPGITIALLVETAADFLAEH